MKVVYVTHSAYFGGAERSLLEILDALPTRVGRLLAAPEGALTEAAAELGVPVVRTSAADVSLRPHPIHTTRALAGLVRLAATTRRVARGAQADVVHANTIRAGLAAVGATYGGGPPAVVHIRDVPPRNPAMDGVRRLLSGRAAALVANSHHTAREFARDLPGVEVQVIHNGIDLRPLGAPPAARQEARRRLALGAEQPVIAVVGQLVDWKGQADAIHVLAQLRHAHPDICLLIVGGPNPTPGTRIDNGAYAESLDVLARELGVERHVRLLGHRDDVPSLLPAVDVLLVPSWEEPFGRVVLEGMAMRLPVVATDAGGPAEIITTGQDGVLLTPRRIDVWVRTVGELLDAPEARRRIGDRARDRVARDFTLEQHATRLVEVYQAVIERDDRRLSGASAGGSSSPA